MNRGEMARAEAGARASLLNWTFHGGAVEAPGVESKGPQRDGCGRGYGTGSSRMVRIAGVWVSGADRHPCQMRQLLDDGEYLLSFWGQLL